MSLPRDLAGGVVGASTASLDALTKGSSLGWRPGFGLLRKLYVHDGTGGSPRRSSPLDAATWGQDNTLRAERQEWKEYICHVQPWEQKRYLGEY
jgi:hypothetical protein